MTSAQTPPFERGKRSERKIDVSRLFDKLPPSAIEAESAVLGSMILDWRVCGEVVQIIKSPEDFYKPAHAAVYEALLSLYNDVQSIDMVQLTQKLVDKNMLEQVGGVEYLIELFESVPSAVSAGHYARIVREKALVRSLIDASGMLLHQCYNSGDSADDLLAQAGQLIYHIQEKRGITDASDLHGILEETMAFLEAHDGRSVTGLETGFFELDEMTNGLHGGEMTIIAARPSMGKAQPLDAKVLTETGWSAMGDLEIGDRLASVDGQPSVVKGIYPQGERQVYRVTLSDGRSTECCEEHLWQVSYRCWDGPRVLETAKLREMLERKRYANRLWIEPFCGAFGSDAELPVDPWLLGCLIGDGTLSGTAVRFSCADGQTLKRVEAVIGEHLTLTHAGRYDYRIVQEGGVSRKGHEGWQANPLKAAIQGLGLWGSNAANKFIPKAYLDASYEQRADLLAGLIDTDGWVESWGSLRFATASKQLARDVITLIRSLGGSGSYSRKETTYTYRSEKRRGLPAYVCNLQHADAARFARQQAKRDRLTAGRQRQRRLNIVSIEPTRITPTQCIAVSHPSRLYVTDGYIVTHNTAFMLNMAEHIATVNKIPVAVFSLEMGKQQLAQRLLCSRSGVDSQKLRKNMLSRDDFGRLQMTVGELAEAPMFIDDTPGLNPMVLRAKAQRLANERHIKAIFVDYMQLMSEPGSNSRQEEVSSISRQIKALARDLNVPVVCLSQLNRQAEQREGHRPRMSDLRESGSIEQDADVIQMVHREDYFHRSDPDYEPDHLAEIIIAKQRNGPTGVCKLQFHGPTTRFHNLAQGGDY